MTELCTYCGSPYHQQSRCPLKERVLNCIHYASGYKYQLRETYSCRIELQPESPIKTDWIELDSDGKLTIRNGYAWDGPSGPAFDTPSFMRASLVHDALYQLMRERHLNEEHREAADRIMRRICREDGMWPARAWWCYLGVRFGAGTAADPSNGSRIECAPGGPCCGGLPQPIPTSR